MEKFGIFELLDALSALTARDTAAPNDEKNQPSPDDRTFRPPDYGQTATEQTVPRQTNDDALSAFLARHSAVAKKADKNK